MDNRACVAFAVVAFFALGLPANGQTPATVAAAPLPSVDEIQPGDGKLNCAQLTIELNEMNGYAMHGPPHAAEQQPSAGSAVVEAGKSMALQQGTNMVVSHIPGASYLTNILGAHNSAAQTQQAQLAQQKSDAEAAFKAQAKVRHDRLLTLYDHRKCDQ